MEFPSVPSGILFTQMDSAQRNEYFSALSGVGADMIDLRSVYGRNGWMKRLAASPDPKAEDEAERLRWNGMTDQERFDFAYGNALDRVIAATGRRDAEESAVSDANKSVAALSGGRPGNAMAAIAGRYDSGSANEAVFKAIFGG